MVKDQTEAIVDAVKELSAEGPGDILVFLPGEREIRDTADALTSALRIDPAKKTLEVIPLFSRLSAAEQHRVFSSHTGRRIVLSTNVAETSLTVPGIRYVIDSGVAGSRATPRAPRCSACRSNRSHRPPPTSGRSVRTCRRGHRDPALLRGGVRRPPGIHRPRDPPHQPGQRHPPDASLRLGSIEDFPFVEPPDRRNITAGIDLLTELGALATGEPTYRRRRNPQLDAQNPQVGGRNPQFG